MTFQCSMENIDFDEWIVEIRKGIQINGQTRVCSPLDKSSSVPYQMISQTPSSTVWSKLKRRLQEVYYFVATDVHAATDLLRSSLLMNHFRITLPTGLKCVIEA